MPRVTCETRKIGLIEAIALVSGAMLGAGVFVTPSLVARAVNTPGEFMIAWALGALVALAGAAVYSSLGRRLPQAGGDYAYLKAAFGSAPAFAAGWVLFVGIFGGSIATMALPLADELLVAAGASYGSHTLRTPVALLVVSAVTWLNVQRVRIPGYTQIALTVVPVLVFFAASVTVLLGGASADTVLSLTQVEAPSRSWLVEPYALAVGAVFFTYSGFNAAAYAGGSVRRPERNLPLALLIGTLVVAALYLNIAYALVKTLGVERLAGVDNASAMLASALPHPAWAPVLRVATTLALASALNATVMGGGQVARALALGGHAPKAWARSRDGAIGSPAALGWQAAVAGAFVVTGTLTQVLMFTSLSMLVLGLATTAALGVFLARESVHERPIRFLCKCLPALVYGAAVTLATASMVHANHVWGESLTEQLLPWLGLAAPMGLYLWYRRRPEASRA